MGNAVWLWYVRVRSIRGDIQDVELGHRLVKKVPDDLHEVAFGVTTDVVHFYRYSEALSYLNSLVV